MAIRNRLKDVRHELKMEKGEFAKFLGMKHPQYSRYENNIKQPNLETVMKICNKVNKKVEDLMEYVPDE